MVKIKKVSLKKVIKKIYIEKNPHAQNQVFYLRADHSYDGR